jgi:hypothetical protein
MKSNWVADTSGGGIPLKNFDLPPGSPILKPSQQACTGQRQPAPRDCRCQRQHRAPRRDPRFCYLVAVLSRTH